MAMISPDTKDIKSYSKQRLKEAKETEANTKMYTKKINNYTIVSCKKEKDLKKYEKQINSINIITKQDRL